MIGIPPITTWSITMRSIIGVVLASFVGLVSSTSAHAEYCMGPYGLRNYPPQVCHHHVRRAPLPFLGHRGFERYSERYLERHHRSVVRRHEVIRRNVRPQGPTIVKHLVEFDDGQAYCSKYVPGTRFAYWKGSGPSRKAHCE